MEAAPKLPKRQGLLDWVVDFVLWVFPQDASGDLKLCPITGRLCNFCSGGCLVIAVVTHLTCEYAPTRPAVTIKEDPWMWFLLQMTASLALAGLTYELAINQTISIMKLKKIYNEDLGLRCRLRLNKKMQTVFAILTFLYHCMAFDIQYVHRGWLAEHYGGHQIVYTWRYIEWVTCAPLVFSIVGQMPHTPDGKPRNGIIPSAMLTGIYCIISWQGLVVTNVWAAWICIGWAFLSYFVASIEQLLFAWYLKDLGRAGPLRAGLLLYLVVMIGLYGAVYLLPIPGLISATAENKFYCIFDASFKLGTSTMVIATYDIAYNAEMRRRAQATTEDLQNLVDTARVPIFTVDRRGLISQWNKKAAELTGISPEEANGMPFISMINNQSKRAVASETISKVLRGEKVSCFETSVLAQDANLRGKKDRKEAILTLSVSSRRDRSGTITGAMLVGCDLTEIEGFKEAEVRKARFMAVMSHELRSPLHGIKGLSERLVDGENDAKKARLLKMIGSCATRLLDLVINIMGMASLVQKDQDGNPKNPTMQRDPMEVPRIIDEIVTLVKSSVDKSGNPLLRPAVALQNKVGPMPIVEADTHRCTQVFYNIVTNACKFTLSGSITIGSRVDPHGNWIEVSIADTGRGIPEHALERIFQPFEQEDQSETRHYEGVGLGLSIAMQIVKLHGGRIDVQSQVGVGTTFFIRLPIIMGGEIGDTGGDTSEEKSTEETPENTGDAAVAKASSEEPQASTLERECSSPRKLRQVPGRTKPLILSVDDDEINQLVIRGILESQYEVVTFMDGPSALDWLESNANNLPDCILLDVMMPEMSGYEVCRTVRQSMRLDLPILMLSADPTTAASSKGFENGCNDYITKPFHKQILLAHISAALYTDDA